MCRPMVDDEDEAEEAASGNDDELLIQAARRRRVISSNGSTLSDPRNRDETLRSMYFNLVCIQFMEFTIYSYNSTFF